jgi:hypothetical protein
MADDGEKFGMWPGTISHFMNIYGLTNFNTLEENSPKTLKQLLLKKYCRAISPTGKNIAPTNSYVLKCPSGLCQVDEQNNFDA